MHRALVRRSPSSVPRSRRDRSNSRRPGKSCPADLGRARVGLICEPAVGPRSPKRGARPPLRSSSLGDTDSTRQERGFVVPPTAAWDLTREWRDASRDPILRRPADRLTISGEPRRWEGVGGGVVMRAAKAVSSRWRSPDTRASLGELERALAMLLVLRPPPTTCRGRSPSRWPTTSPSSSRLLRAAPDTSSRVRATFGGEAAHARWLARRHWRCRFVTSSCCAASWRVANAWGSPIEERNLEAVQAHRNSAPPSSSRSGTSPGAPSGAYT